MKLSTIFQSTSSEPPDPQSRPRSRDSNNSQTGRPVSRSQTPDPARALAKAKRDLDRIIARYLGLQHRYYQLPLPVRRDIHTAANEELIYAAAILEPPPKEQAGKRTEHGEEELIPCAPYWYDSIGELTNKFTAQKKKGTVSTRRAAKMQKRVDVELARLEKVQAMIDFICASAFSTPSAPLAIILREWNFACLAIADGSSVSAAIANEIDESQGPSDSRQFPLGARTKQYFGLDIREAVWPSAAEGCGPRLKPGPRWNRAESGGSKAPAPKIYLTVANQSTRLLC